MSSEAESPDTVPPPAAPPVLAGVSGESRRGPGRHRNDDRWAVAAGSGTVLLAVADGMGFTAGGGVAATIALRAVLDLTGCAQTAGPSDATAPGDAAWSWDAASPVDATGPEATGAPAAGPGLPFGLEEALAAAVARGHRRVRAAAPASMPETIRPGTTLTAALVAGDRLHLAHAGDSSCWLYRQGELRRLTDVHTSAAVLVAAGAVDSGSEAARRLDNLLTRYVGMPGLLQPQLCTVRLRAGDRLLLASDGLTRAVPPPVLAALLARPRATAADLIAAARGCGDDATAVLATVGADYPAGAEVLDVAAAHAAPADVTEVRVLGSGR